MDPQTTRVTGTFIPMSFYDASLDDWTVTATWASFGVLYALWCVSWLANALGQRRPFLRVVNLPEGSKEPPKDATPKVSRKSLIQTVLDRFRESQEGLGDLVQMLLPALGINTFAGGYEGAAMGLSTLFMLFGISTLVFKDPYGQNPNGRWTAQKIAKVACPVASIATVALALYHASF